MFLKYLPANQAWVFLFGRSIDTAVLTNIGDYGVFFPSRDAAVKAAEQCGLTVARDGHLEIVYQTGGNKCTSQ